MASLIRDKGGTKRIQFMLAKGDRRTIRLGKINVKAAERFYARVENLIDSVQTATPIDSQTAQWLAELPEDTYSKLVQAGLAEPREATQRHTIGGLLDEYFDTMSVKESTRTRYAQSKRLLLDHFDKDHPLESITTRDADKWRSALESIGYAPAKIARDVSVARMFFKQAVRWSMIPSNPFEGVRAGAQTNRERLYYLNPEDAHKLIEAAPDADWRCIIALARFGGLRCPSEVLGVRWGDIDWDQNRMLVRSPKTERHIGKGERMVPLFPELQTILQDAFDQSPEGAVFVVNRYRSTSANLRTNLNRIINRAGLTAWPRLFNAMRASRATELASQYPAATCTAWLGHTQAIAEAHYHMVRDEDFDRAAATTATKQAATNSPFESGADSGAHAAQNRAQRQAASTSSEWKSEAQTKEGSALMPTPAGRCNALHIPDNGRGGTRTHDISRVRRTL
tara:strand:- start:29837 stop:31195 length:1359 start_codon:yes stop_codon:yes gene_type:complete